MLYNLFLQSSIVNVTKSQIVIPCLYPWYGNQQAGGHDGFYDISIALALEGECQGNVGHVGLHLLPGPGLIGVLVGHLVVDVGSIEFNILQEVQVVLVAPLQFDNIDVFESCDLILAYLEKFLQL